MRQNLAPLTSPSAPNAICKNPLQLNQNNQSEPGVSEGVLFTAGAHTAWQPHSAAHVLTRSSLISSVSGFRSFANAMADKQPPAMT